MFQRGWNHQLEKYNVILVVTLTGWRVYPNCTATKTLKFILLMEMKRGQLNETHFRGIKLDAKVWWVWGILPIYNSIIVHCLGCHSIYGRSFPWPGWFLWWMSVNSPPSSSGKWRFRLRFPENVHPRKLTCPLKRHYFSREYIFQPLIFRGHSLVFRGVMSFVCHPFVRDMWWLFLGRGASQCHPNV